MARGKTAAGSSGARSRSGSRSRATSRRKSSASSSRRTGGNQLDRGGRARREIERDHPVLAFVGEDHPRIGAFERLDRTRLWGLLRLFVGLLLVPLSWVTFETFIRSFGHATLQGNFWRTSELWFFCIGTAMWLVLFFGLRSRAMLWTYVAGHELTHAFFVLLSGGNVRGLHISADGGHVVTNKNNLVIALSPYFVPFYTVLVILAWWICQAFDVELGATHARVLFAVIGFTWTFHVTFTVWMLVRDQPDLDHYGRVFSVGLIMLVNLLLISVLLVLASPEVSLWNFAETWGYNLLSFGMRLKDSVLEIVDFFAFWQP